MGKLEKGIVLSVLAVIAVILVLSLTLDDPLKKDKAVMVGSSSPKTAAAAASAEERAEKTDKAAPSAPPATALVAQANAQPPLNPQAKPLDGAGAPGVAASNAPANSSAQPPSTLLSTSVAPPRPDSSAPAAGIPSALPAGTILKSAEGLQDSYLSDMKFYMWQSGDSFRSVAAKYYGDAAKFTLLRRSNEGRENLQAGDKIFVPVFDLDAPRAGEAWTAAPAAVSAPASANGKPVQPKDSAAGASATKSADLPGGPRVHVVKDGESLWRIAKLELGDGGRWNEIFDANRDVLSKPEAVHSGMRLRIPAK
jgi:nucleoid-associated protein YgaU